MWVRLWEWWGLCWFSQHVGGAQRKKGWKPPYYRTFKLHLSFAFLKTLRHLANYSFHIIVNPCFYLQRHKHWAKCLERRHCLVVSCEATFVRLVSLSTPNGVAVPPPPNPCPVPPPFPHHTPPPSVPPDSWQELWDTK